MTSLIQNIVKDDASSMVSLLNENKQTNRHNQFPASFCIIYYFSLSFDRLIQGLLEKIMTQSQNLRFKTF